MITADQLRAAQSEIQQTTSPISASSVVAPCPFKEKSWIEIKLVGTDDVGIPNVQYLITASDGKEIRGKTDANGWARASDIVPGPCKVSFPTLDQDLWTPV